MRKLRLLIVSVLLAVPVLGVSAGPAHACADTTDLDGCAKVNYICQKVFKTDANCVG